MCAVMAHIMAGTQRRMSRYGRISQTTGALRNGQKRQAVAGNNGNTVVGLK